MDVKFQTTNCKFFDLEGLHPFFEGCRNVAATRNYIRKDGNYWGALEDEKEGYMPVFVDQVQKATSLTEALKLAKSPMMASNVKTIYEARKNIIDNEVMERFGRATPRGWQRDLWDALMCNPNDRQINWIWDSQGGSGKTYFTKMFYCQHPEETIAMFAISRAIDAMNLITNAIESGKKMKYVFINLTRQLENKEHVYTIVEQIKDGWITNNKYKCLTIPMNCPHVTVFANFEPDRSKLSRDRWCITDIGGEKRQEQAPVTLLIGAPKDSELGSWMA